MGPEASKPNGGAALVYVIFVTIILGIISLALASIVTTESVVSVQHLDRVKAFFVAEAGLERGIGALLTGEWNADEPKTAVFQIGEGAAFVTVTPQLGGGLGGDFVILQIHSAGRVPNPLGLPPGRERRACQIVGYRIQGMSYFDGLRITDSTWLTPTDLPKECSGS